jgi:hypothetical protein
VRARKAALAGLGDYLKLLTEKPFFTAGILKAGKITASSIRKRKQPLF